MLRDFLYFTYQSVTHSTSMTVSFHLLLRYIFMPTLSPSPRERFALASILFLSVHILRELWAYYENWRSASRVLEEEVSAALEVLSATPE
jgi:hypothetical protein